MIHVTRTVVGVFLCFLFAVNSLYAFSGVKPALVTIFSFLLGYFMSYIIDRIEQKPWGITFFVIGWRVLLLVLVGIPIGLQQLTALQYALEVGPPIWYILINWNPRILF